MQRKGRPRHKGEAPKNPLSSVEKIQMHLNAQQGRIKPKGLPKLTDEEYLILQQKLLSLRNEKIATSKFQQGASVFPKPILLTEPSYPQVPGKMPITLSEPLMSGYQTINGQLVPTPMPDRLSQLGKIGAPNQAQKTVHSVNATFGMHAGAGTARHGGRQRKTTGRAPTGRMQSRFLPPQQEPEEFVHPHEPTARPTAVNVNVTPPPPPAVGPPVGRQLPCIFPTVKT